jgi:hypothetical protein
MTPPRNSTPDDASAEARRRVARKLDKIAKALEPKRGDVQKQQPPPLALFPLRLEYRLIEAEQPAPFAAFTEASVREAHTRERSATRVTDHVARAATRHLEFVDVRFQRREIWWRWFPDDPFAAQGIPPITNRESEALNRFRAGIGVAAWWDVTDPAVGAAFAALSREIGAWRALHLLRVPDGGSANWEGSVGALAALPQHVALYAINGEQLTQLGVGERIPDELRLSPGELQPGGWLVDFSAAVQQGMGIRLRAADKVAAAANAEWIVAVGLTSTDGAPVFEKFLTDALANGNVELVPPGTPTNRVPGRTPAFEREPADPIAFLQRAAARERSGAVASSTDASHLAAALGIDPHLLDTAPGGMGFERERARAMSRALLPGLTNALFQNVPQLSPERHNLLDFLCDHAVSRGPFSPVRFGHTPYGILPIALLDRMRPPDRAPSGERHAFEFCGQVASASIAWLSEETTQLPVVQPDDPNAHEKLDEALRLGAVSQRIVVRNLPGAAPLALRCPLVKGPDFEPRTYLRLLAERPLAELPNPDERDSRAPLLYRLVRFSREVLEGLGGKRDLVTRRPLRTTTHGSLKTPATATTATANLIDALRLLADVPDENLERLMLEVIDFTDYRADAWFTALAAYRLKVLRASQPRGLRTGWYGFLGRLRLHADRSDDGFIQAPSVAQATTAGMLRAAALRHPGSAFEIDLSSRRARQAVRLLDELRQGATLGQALGNAAARRLHDEGQDFVLHLLRAAYPATSDRPPGATPPLDGLSMHDDPTLVRLQALPLVTNLAQAERTRIVDRARAANEHIAEVLDGLADLVVAEAAHQLTLGNTGAANAWMQVLSGDPPPHELVFLRTPREAQGSTYRWALLRAPVASASSNPRALIAPTLAALSAEVLGNFQSAAVSVSLLAADGTVATSTFLLQDLGVEPIDLAIGGESELLLRARFALWREWRTDQALQTTLGAPPLQSVVDYMSAHRLKLETSISVNGAPTIESFLDKARPLIHLLSESRALRPQDLAMAASGAVTPADIAPVLQGAAAQLMARCHAAETALIVAEGSLRASASAVAAQARLVALERAQAGEQSPSARHAVTVLNEQHASLENALESCSFFALPDALHPFGTEDLIAGPAGVEALATRIEGLLVLRRQALAAARSEAQAQTGNDPMAWQACVARLCRALSDAGDGDALAVWPEFDRTPALTPHVASSGDVAASTSRLAHLRPRLAVASRLAARIPLVAHVCRPPAASTGNEPPTRDDLDRPPSVHESVFIGSDDVFTKPRLCGAVIDEWSDERPSRRQVTGLALHYDAPQSESPKAVLLGVPGSDEEADWSLDSAAALVRETIRWMKIRSLASSRSSLSRVVAPLFSVIPPVGSKPVRRRLPAGRVRWLADQVSTSGVLIERVSGVPESDMLPREQRPAKNGGSKGR